MKKFKFSSLKGSALGLLMAIGAGIAAFSTEIESQKKDRKIEEMNNRLNILENTMKDNEK